MSFNIRKTIVQLKSHRLWIETIGKQGEKLGIDEVDLRNVDLSPYPLDQANITDCIFDGMDLTNKDISSSLLCSSTFRSAHLVGADLRKSNVSYVDFTNANMKAARLADCECIETVFAKADLSDANLVGGLFDEVDFRHAVLSNADIRLASFEGVLLNGAILTGVRGIEEAFIKSINIGTVEEPILLMGEEAGEWLQNKSLE
ncbi:pentapeptide repeat-containing protein [Rossellomorea marisflavi]|uniref:pentapeptide repeat-containing protein n=1 Tax=Rossellomorea marisflavi TaxID=189381 RepID=UPI001EE36020|nr:pentapeptide repeat-containing protein [Rossellomorea marisflavi]MCM2588063.1 pentapeptide repeat-containing protein [Rossellomorea marisflavi]UKS66152.1 pentapeptide repeat-containing protein [Rossellomorea marisflavi]